MQHCGAHKNFTDTLFSRQQYQIPYCLLFLWKTCPAKCRSYFTAKSFKFDSECVMTPWQVIFARTHPHLSSYLPPRQPKVATTNVSKCKVDFLSVPRQRFLWQRAQGSRLFLARMSSAPYALHRQPWLTFDWDNSLFVHGRFSAHPTIWSRYLGTLTKENRVGYKAMEPSVQKYIHKYSLTIQM